MRLKKIDPANIDIATIDEAASIIRAGGLVAFPTETVYGLGADATDAAAVNAIFGAKGRPSYNPLIVHVHDVAAAKRCVSEWPAAADLVTQKFWPGPLTIVLHKQPNIAANVTAGLDTVAVRVPAHPVALALLRAADRPIAAPSANRSTQVSPTEGRHVVEGLTATEGLILDAGPTNVGIESTVIDLTGPIPIILRPGMITRADLGAILGDVETASTAAGGEARRSPGMLDKHYSPRARLVIAADDRTRTLDDLAVQEARSGRRPVVLARSDYQSRQCAVRQMPVAAGDYARALYGMLHRLDAEGFDVIIVEPVPAGDEWEGVRDRLARASERNVRASSS